MYKRIATLALSVALFSSTFAKAETVPNNLPGSIASILQLIESLAMSGGSLAGMVTLGGCTPTVVPVSLNQFDFHFTASAVCPINGDVKIGVLPITASIHLQFVNIPFVQSVDADFTATVRMAFGKGMTTRWNLANGHIAYRLLPTMPLTDRNLSGYGTRVRVWGMGLDIDSHFNMFDASGNGSTFNRKIHRKLFSGKVDTSTTCALSGAVASDPTSGTQTACH